MQTKGIFKTNCTWINYIYLLIRWLVAYELVFTWPMKTAAYQALAKTDSSEPKANKKKAEIRKKK